MEEEVVIAGAGAKCFYTNRRAAKKCSSKVGVRFCPRPCTHKVQVKYAIPVTDCAALVQYRVPRVSTSGTWPLF